MFRSNVSIFFFFNFDCNFSADFFFFHVCWFSYPFVWMPLPCCWLSSLSRSWFPPLHSSSPCPLLSGSIVSCLNPALSPFGGAGSAHLLVWMSLPVLRIFLRAACCEGSPRRFWVKPLVPLTLALPPFCFSTLNSPPAVTCSLCSDILFFSGSHTLAVSSLLPYLDVPTLLLRLESQSQRFYWACFMYFKCS